MEIGVDRKRMKLMLDRLLLAYARNEYPYNLPWVHSPQIPENMPKNLELGSPAHARFLFCVCYWMRGGIKSNTAFRALARLYEQWPTKFVPHYMQYTKPEWLVQRFRQIGSGFQADEIARFWKKNFQILRREYGGDPVNIFEGISTYEEACDRIVNRRKADGSGSGFYGFREKMTSMLIYFLTDAGLIKPFLHPPPVDFHVLRLFIANGILHLPEIPESGKVGHAYEQLAGIVRPLLYDYCRQQGVNPLLLVNALWLLSSNLCDQNPGNRSMVGKMEIINGKRIRVRSGRRTPITPVPITWSHSQTATYLRTCGSCVLENSCRWLVPSAYYYVSGVVKVRGPRTKPPQRLLFQPPTS